MLHSELIEWQVVKRQGALWKHHLEGAQSVFGLSTARKIVKKLGPPWEVRHTQTLELPEKEK